jgi:hypothetical protein
VAKDTVLGGGDWSLPLEEVEPRCDYRREATWRHESLPLREAEPGYDHDLRATW